MAENFSSWSRDDVKPASSRGDRLLATACLVSIIACPAAAKAPSEPGPAASASIQISVSLARRYGLAKDGGSGLPSPEQAGRDPYCLASTGGEMLSPVLLIYLSPSRADEIGLQAAGKATRLSPCRSSSRTPAAVDALEGAGSVQAVIVTPQ